MNRHFSSNCLSSLHTSTENNLEHFIENAYAYLLCRQIKKKYVAEKGRVVLAQSDLQGSSSTAHTVNGKSSQEELPSETRQEPYRGYVTLHHPHNRQKRCVLSDESEYSRDLHEQFKRHQTQHTKNSQWRS